MDDSKGVAVVRTNCGSCFSSRLSLPTRRPCLTLTLCLRSVPLNGMENFLDGRPSGVGQFMTLDLSRLSGYEVVTIASPRNHEWIRLPLKCWARSQIPLINAEAVPFFPFPGKMLEMTRKRATIEQNRSTTISVTYIQFV